MDSLLRALRKRVRAVSSDGRAPGLHPGGRRFEPVTAHAISRSRRPRLAPVTEAHIAHYRKHGHVTIRRLLPRSDGDTDGGALRRHARRAPLERRLVCGTLLEDAQRSPAGSSCRSWPRGSDQRFRSGPRCTATAHHRHRRHQVAAARQPPPSHPRPPLDAWREHVQDHHRVRPRSRVDPAGVGAGRGQLPPQERRARRLCRLRALVKHCHNTPATSAAFAPRRDDPVPWEYRVEKPVVAAERFLVR